MRFVSVANCTCPADWRAIRRALGFSAPRFAAVLGVSERAVWWYERRDSAHKCPRAECQLRLREFLKPHVVTLLRAGIAYPWPEDFPTPPPEPVIRPIVVCRVCGQDEETHIRCSGCGFLTGPGHARPSGIPGLCYVCAETYARRVARADIAATGGA